MPFSALLLLLLSVVFFSCSKESPITKDQTAQASVRPNDSPNNSSRLSPRYFGFISGVLVPAPAKAKIIAFNDEYTFEAIAQADGSFVINDLVPASYNVRIDYVPVGGNDYFSTTIPKVVVSAGTVTDLGNISLN